MFGGIYQGVTTNDTWAWDGANWTEVSSADLPPKRSNPGMAYDSIRGRIMLYGGSGIPASQAGDMWEWDLSGWMRRTEPSPPARSVSIAYDPVQARVVLIDVSASPRQVWEFDGATGAWSFRGRTLVTLPSARSLVFDASRGHVVFAAGAGLYEWNCPGTFSLPWISSQPVGATVTPGASLAMSMGLGGTPPFTFQWSKGGVPLSNGGHIAGATEQVLWISSIVPADGGTYAVHAANAGGSVDSTGVQVTVVTGCGNPVCYGNCDQSTACPLLTANDFQCYFNHFAIQDAYSNCDGSTSVPLITANDFQCFLNAYASGCP
jgi:hypothetical protein